MVWSGMPVKKIVNTEDVTVMSIVPVDTSISTNKEHRMEKAGASREKSYKAMADGLTATKVIALDKFGTTSEEPDHAMRLKSAELIARINGDLKPDVAVDNRTINVGPVDAGFAREMIEMIKGIKTQLLGLKESGSQTGEIIDV